MYRRGRPAGCGRCVSGKGIAIVARTSAHTQSTATASKSLPFRLMYAAIFGLSFTDTIPMRHIRLTRWELYLVTICLVVIIDCVGSRVPGPTQQPPGQATIYSEIDYSFTYNY